MVAKGKSIGKVRKYFVNRNPREEWGSRIWLGLMRICWQKKIGDYKLRRLLYYIRCLALKYFPSSLVFEARSSTGSFAWQSLLEARHVIEKGMMWRVGDGSQIQVFHDNWIPGRFPTKAVSHTPGCEDDSIVSSLIDQTTK